jgi:hypothetical protein
MKPVERKEILDLAEYELVRGPFRNRIIELKRRRRVPLGPNMSVLFENRDTVLFQIQEMLRTERITREDAILHEVETYNELVPGADELSATVFLEYPESSERDRALVALAGLEDKFYVTVAGVRASARNETRGTRTDRTTAVHYMKFPLPQDAAEAVRRGASAAVAVGVSHPAYSAETVLGADVLAELREDLR